MKKEDSNTPPEVMESIDKFEDQILANLVTISQETAEKMIKTLPGEISNKLVKILRDSKINHITQK